MKTWMIVCLLVLSCCYISPAVAQEKVDRAFVANAIKIKLSVSNPSFSLGESVTVTITVANTAKQPLHLPNTLYDWTVRREDGGTVSETPEGRKRSESRLGARTMNVTGSLDAGQSVSMKENLSQLYLMDSPGVYLVGAAQAMTDGTGTDYIKSNTLRITIQ